MSTSSSCRVCGVEGRALCYPCQGRISAASPKHKARLARFNASSEGKAQLARLHEKWVGSPEHKAQLIRLHETWNGSPENRAVLARLNKTWIGSPEHKAHLVRLHSSPEHKALLARLHKTWIGSPEQKAALARLWEKPRSLAQLANLAAAGKKVAAKPTWPEARFYGLVFGWLNGNIKDFRFQEVIPTEHCAHRVDARRGNVIFELDGGGHHVFKDRHEHDRLEDEDYTAMGYHVVRATNETDLFLRVLQVVEQ